jgi:hypothetical protein
MNGIQIIVLVFQVLAVVLTAAAYFNIHRRRVVYSIKTAVLRMPHGTELDKYGCLETDHINKILQTGEYTILHVAERDADKDLELILGKIKSDDAGFWDKVLRFIRIKS